MPREGPMLLLLASLTAAQPIAVDIAGMQPQLAIVRRDGAARGWRVTCEGRSGEERVIRIVFPPGTPPAAIGAYFDLADHLGSSARFYHAGDTLPQSCDSEPTVSSGSPARVLALGPA